MNNRTSPLIGGTDLCLRISALAVLFAVITPIAAADPGSWHDWYQDHGEPPAVPQQSAVPEAAGGGLVVHPDAAAFDDATDGWPMAVEDFEDSPRPPISIGPCDEPLNHVTGQPGTAFIQSCYLPGNVIEDFSVRTNIPQGFGLFAFGDGQFGMDSYKIGTVPGGLRVLVDLHDRPTAVAMDLNDWNSVSQLNVWAYGDDGLIGNFSVQPQSPVDPVFAGFTSPVPVKRVEISGPGSAGIAMDNLRFGGGGPQLAVEVDTRGGVQPTGVAAAVTGVLDLGPVAVGTTGQGSLQLRNDGFVALAIDEVQSPQAPFALTTDECTGASLPPGETCTVSVEFAPLWVADFDDRVSVTSDGGDGEIRLTGQGVLGQLLVGPDALVFPDTTPGSGSGSEPRQVQLVNPSAAPVQVTEFSDPGGPFPTANDTCGPVPFTLDPGASCHRSYGFVPPEFGIFAGTVRVASDSPDSPVTVTLSGRGAAVGGDPDFPYPVPLLGPAGLLLMMIGMWAVGLWRRRRDTAVTRP